MRRFLLVFVYVVAASSAAAQTNINQASNDRMDRLERDLQLIQKQLVVGGETPPSVVESEDSAPASGGVTNARLGAQLSQLQEELRKLRGQLEQNEFSNKRNAEAIERLQKDVDFRLTEMEKKQAAPPPPAMENAPEEPAVSANTTGKPKAIIKVEDKKPDEKAIEPVPEVTKKFDQPRDHYNYAFRLLNQTKYDEAAGYFQSFIKQFPKDPLVGNAYYWLGETHYIKRDYVPAADHFRQGFEALPSGPKAADNLLKLAMTLSALKRNTDACTVLGQITTKFANASTVLLKKAEEEKLRIGCS